MKKQIFILSIAVLMSADYAKSQCGATIMGPNPTTQNRVPVFGPTNGCVINGIIQDNGTNVGISVSPSYKLDVSGDINSAQGNAYRLAGNKILWYNSTAAAMDLSFLKKKYN